MPYRGQTADPQGRRQGQHSGRGSFGWENRQRDPWSEDPADRPGRSEYYSARDQYADEDMPSQDRSHGQGFYLPGEQWRRDFPTQGRSQGWNRQEYGQRQEYGSGQEYGQRRGPQDWERRGYGQDEYQGSSFDQGEFDRGEYEQGQRGMGLHGKSQRGVYGQRRLSEEPWEQRSRSYGSEHGFQSFRGRGPQNYRRADDRIRDDVCDRLTDDDYLDASSIQVTVNEGEVRLSGTVENRNAKWRAEDLAQSISGAKDVINELRVQREASQSKTSESSKQGQDPSTSSGKSQSQHR